MDARVTEPAPGDRRRRHAGLLLPQRRRCTARATTRSCRACVEHLAAAEADGVPLVFLVDTHAPDDPEFAMFPPHCVEGSGEDEVVPELAEFAERGTVVRKRTFSGFHGTDLDAVLARLAPRGGGGRRRVHRHLRAAHRRRPACARLRGAGAQGPGGDATTRRDTTRRSSTASRSPTSATCWARAWSSASAACGGIRLGASSTAGPRGGRRSSASAGRSSTWGRCAPRSATRALASAMRPAEK